MAPTFRVKNFEKFQHYKDRAPPWIKLYNEILDDYEFGILPDATKMHLIAIWLLASRSENKIPYDEKWVARRINANDAVDLALLVKRGFLLLDQELHTAEQVASTQLAECLSREREEAEDIDKRERREETREVALSDGNPGFDDFWRLWPNKVGRSVALKAFSSARKRGAGFNEIMDGVENYIRDKPPDRSWLNPATFLNQSRWEDQPATVSATNGKPKNAVIQAADDLCRRIAGFDGPECEDNDLCGDEGQDTPRLLSYR